jgi:hypothetical protein
MPLAAVYTASTIADVRRVAHLCPGDLRIPEWYDPEVLVVAVTGVILDVVLVAFFYAAFIAVLWHFGPGNPKPAYRHCPACQRDGLWPLDAGATMPGRLTVYRCVHCNAGYRMQLDGTLAAMSDPV